VRKIENYFEYYWSHDRNYAIKSGEGQRFMSELPKYIKYRLFSDYLFKDFLYLFKQFFVLDKKSDNWESSSWANFMIKVLCNLEPRIYKPGEPILLEDEDVNEMLFITHGVVSFFC
jgi:hypothetical protein